MQLVAKKENKYIDIMKILITGGSRYSNCSMKEDIILCERITGKIMNYSYDEDNRIGDHIWYISNPSKFKNHYPNWNYKDNFNNILEQIYAHQIQNK